MKFCLGHAKEFCQAASQPVDQTRLDEVVQSLLRQWILFGASNKSINELGLILILLLLQAL